MFIESESLPKKLFTIQCTGENREVNKFSFVENEICCRQCSGDSLKLHICHARGKGRIFRKTSVCLAKCSSLNFD
jgi:hypothetical protein